MLEDGVFGSSAAIVIFDFRPVALRLRLSLDLLLSDRPCKVAIIFYQFGPGYGIGHEVYLCNDFIVSVRCHPVAQAGFLCRGALECTFCRVGSCAGAYAAA